MDEMVLNYLKDLDIFIKKKMFILGKNANINKPPSPLQVRIFMYLYEHRNSIVSPKDLVRELKVSKVAISEALTKMENNGNITINDSIDDGRKKILSYTEQGLERMNQMTSSLKTLNEELIKNINDADLQIFISVVQKMKENIMEGKNV